MPRAYVGLGANLGDPPAQLREALRRLAAEPGISLAATSSFYRSAPLPAGGIEAGQPDYCNAVCALDTALAPGQLLAVLHAVERAMGRQRPPQRWAARCIDLDLLHVDGAAAEGPDLRLPHPEIGRRDFVLVPLAEIAPALELPRLGVVAALARTARSLRRWDGAPGDPRRTR